MLNNISLMGRLVANPDIKKGKASTSYAHFTLACDRGYKNKSGEYGIDFFNIVTYVSIDFIEKYLNKGDLISIAGSLETFKTKDGATITVIKAREINLCSKSSSANKKRIDADEDSPFDEL